MTEPGARAYHHGDLRAALLAEARQVLAEGGADALSLRDLARRVEVSHGAPRRHFATRQDLLDALAADGFDSLTRAMRAADDGAGPQFADRLRAVTLTYVRYLTDNAALAEIALTGKNGEHKRPVAPAEGAFQGVLEFIEQGVAAGALQASDSREVATIFLATIHGLVTLSSVGFVAPDRQEVLVQAAVDQLLRGAR